MMVLIVQRCCTWRQLNTMMQSISNSLYVQTYWSCFLLHITKDVIVVLSLNPWLKCDVNGDLSLSMDYSRHRADDKGISVFWVTRNTFFFEGEAEGNVFEVFDVDCFLVFTF